MQNIFYNKIKKILKQIIFFLLTLSGLRLSKKSQREKFLYYSLYAWGVPLCLTSILGYFQKIHFAIRSFIRQSTECNIEDSKS